jgi:hypothetical protein
VDPETLAVARGRLRSVESVQEDQVQPEEHIYAEVHQEDPDAIEVISEEPEVALEATPDVVPRRATERRRPWRSCCRPPSLAAWAGSTVGQGDTRSALCQKRTSCQIPRPQRFELK